MIVDATDGTEVSEVTLPVGGQANDNGWRERPVVRAPRRRQDETYARWENLILPMRFAVRMQGWQTCAS
ncbi:MAG TPA: hypothetical protein VHM31_19230 [Polyangia bacterium]|nr:hypothetical protein [Polyangia bacterium]